MRLALRRRRNAVLIEILFGPDGLAYLTVNGRPLAVGDGWLAVEVS